MRRHRLLVGLVLLCVWAQTLAAQRRDPRIARMREYLRAAAELGHLSGSVLVADSGRILIDTAYGFANHDLGVRNTPDTRFRVASVTKQFTALAIMQLQEAGKLRVGDSIGRYLDSLPDEWRGITIHHLLRHVSGVSDYEEWFDGYITQAYSDYMAQAGAPARIVADARRKPLDFTPGSKFHYSNTGYILLGYIIERVSGEPYEQFLQHHILGPLGMTRSRQDWSDSIIDGRAEGYMLASGAYPIRYFRGLTRSDLVHAHYQLMAPPQADAGLLTTARDLYRWDQALYSERLVSRATLDSIFAPGLRGYGYGWFIQVEDGELIHSHTGGLPGFACIIMRFPARHGTIILLGNIQRMGRTARDLSQILHGRPYAVPRPRQLVPTDSTVHGRWVGQYRSAAGDSVQVQFEAGTMAVRWPEHFFGGMYPESERNFYLPGTQGTVRFIARGGTAEMVILDQEGREIFVGARR